MAFPRAPDGGRVGGWRTALGWQGLQGCEVEKWDASVLSQRTQAVGQLQIKARRGSVMELSAQRGPSGPSEQDQNSPSLGTDKLP